MTTLPTGTVTFLFTDIEGSTTRWEQQPTAMKAALTQHDALMRAAFAPHGGTVIQTAGDSFVVVFAQARAGLAAAVEAQQALQAAPWPAPIGPLRVRAALHSGPGEQRADGYHAEFTLNRLARLLAAGHGGQILVTDTTRRLLDGPASDGVGWRDLGEHWLKDLIRPLHIYQVLAPTLPHEFPPLKTLDAPTPPTGPVRDGAAEVENPYKGLRAFQEADAADFFGREALTERLVARLGEAVPLARFLAVVGPSGSGKSSVVRAGVLPALRRGALPGSEHWLLVELIPGADPLGELAVALAAATGQDPTALLAELQADEYGLLHSAQHLLSDTLPSSIVHRPSSIVLVIDQFEEVFTLVTDEPVRVHFLENLHRAVTSPDSPVRVIVTLRADFYDRPLLYPDPGELVRQRTEVVLPLTPEELARAISSPVARVGVQADAALVGAMIQDVTEQPGALPLLQYALTELFERRENNRLTLAAYRASGSLQAALGRRAEEIYAGLMDAQQEVTRQTFLRLVTLGEGVEDTRRRVRRAELAALPVDADRLDGVLETFSRYRLLTFDRDPGTQEPTVEVAHEALIRFWERLRAWLDTSRADLRVQRQLAAEAEEWARAGQDPSYLAAGARLVQFAALAAGTGATGALALTGEERAYLAASEAEAARRTAAEQAQQVHELELARQTAVAQRNSARRLRVLVSALALFLLVALGLSLFAFNQSQAAQANATEADTQRGRAVSSAATAVANEAAAQTNFTRAEAQRLAAEANRLLAQGGIADVIALLSIRSLNLQYSPQGDAALEGAATLDYPLQRFSGHTAIVGSVAFSPDGQYVLTSSNDQTARLWDVRTGAEVRRFTGHTDYVWGVAFAPDGKTVLTSSRDGTARLWDAQTGAELHRFTGPNEGLFGVAFSPDGRMALAAGFDKTAWLWNVQTGQELHHLAGHADLVVQVAFSPNGRYVLTSSVDKTARLWDALTGAELRSFIGHTGWVYGVAFSPDNKQILTSGLDKTARLWDVQTGAELRRFTGHSGGVRPVAFAPDGKTILTAGDDKTARLWNTATGQEIRRFVGHTSFVEGVAFSPDGRNVLTSSDDGTALLWDTQPQPGLPQITSHDQPVLAVAYSSNGKTILTGSYAGTAQLRETKTGATLHNLTGHSDSIWSGTFSPDGQYVLTGSADKTARLWDAVTGAEVRRFIGHTGAVYSVAYSPDGKYVLTGSGETDMTTRLWDAATGAEIFRFPGRNAATWAVAFSPDGRQVLVSGYGDNPRLWDAHTGAQLRDFPAPPGEAEGGAFALDGKSVVIGGNDGIAYMWDAMTGQEMRRFVGHTAAVVLITFSPNGKYVLTSSLDTTARLWDAQTGEELRRFVGHTAQVNGVAFAPDGKTVLTGSDDGTARLWYTDYHDTIRYLCGRLLRDFSDDERAQYEIKDPTPTCPGK